MVGTITESSMLVVILSNRTTTVKLQVCFLMSVCGSSITKRARKKNYTQVAQQTGRRCTASQGPIKRHYVSLISDKGLGTSAAAIRSGSHITNLLHHLPTKFAFDVPTVTRVDLNQQLQSVQN